MSADSIERGVLHDHLVSVVALATTIACVVALVGAFIVVGLDDREALAQIHSLGTELADHATDPPDALDEMVEHELQELHWFEREIEVWNGDHRIGGAAESSRLQAWAGTKGCRFARIDGVALRVCAVSAATEQLVEARPVSRILAALFPLALALFAISIASTGVVAWWSSRAIRARVAPLSRLDATVSGFQVIEGERLPEGWGAREIDTLAATLNALLTRVDAQVEREHRFISDAAHELRTPLTRLRGQIELTLTELGPDDPRASSLEQAVRTCAELARTTEALLAMAREEQPSDATIDLSEICHSVHSTLSPADGERVTVGGASSAPARGDEAMLRLVLYNLVDNATKYSDGPVQMTAEHSGAVVRVRVEDRGPGLPPSDLARVLEPFVRGPSATVRGMGLGLALASHAARLHKGALTVENRAGGGLQVTLELPEWQPR